MDSASGSFVFSQLMRLRAARAPRRGPAPAGRTRSRLPVPGNKLTPSKRRPSGGELFGDGAVVLLGVERAVFTDGIAQKQVEDGSGRLIERADLMNDRASLRLIIGTDGCARVV